MKKTVFAAIAAISTIGVVEACDHVCASYCLYYHPSNECVQTCRCPEYVLNQSVQERHERELAYIANLQQS